MSVDFVGESETHELYCVDGSHMFELDVHAHPDEIERIAGVFIEWANFMKEVAKIHANGSN
jgi:hypothetical protein